MDTQTQIDRLIELAIVQRAELKALVEQLPQLREYLGTEIEKTFEQVEPQLRGELEEFCNKRTEEFVEALRGDVSEQVGEILKTLETAAAAKYSALMAERERNAELEKKAEDKIAEAAAALPSQVKEIVTAELARFPRAGEIDQLRKEFAEPRGLNPRGKWIAGETYNKLDLVTYNGDSFVSNIDGNTEKPSRNAANWTLNAARGAYGGGGGITSLNDVLNAPTSGQIIGSQNGQYVPKTLIAGANITINETASSITIIGDEGQISLQDGTAAAPSLFFTNDTDTGIYRPAANTLGISVSGTQVAYFDQNGLTVPNAGIVAGGSFHGANGNANNPSLSFDGDQDTGFFRHAPNEIGIALGGTQYATLTSTTFSITPNISTSGNLTVSGTGTSSFQSTTPPTVQIANTTSGLGNTQNGANGVLLGTLKFGQPNSSAANFPSVVGRFSLTNASFARNTALDFYISDAAGPAIAATLDENKALLLGTTTNSGNGKLQLATHTTSAGGIGFGTDVSLYRDAAGSLTQYASSGNAQLLLNKAGASILKLLSDGSNNYIAATGGLYIQTNASTTALTLDSSQKAKFEGAVGIGIANGAYGESSALTIQGTGKTTPIFVNVNGGDPQTFLRFSNGLSNGGNFGTTDGSNFTIGRGAGTAITIDSSQNATFAAKVNITNDGNLPTSRTLNVGGTDPRIALKKTGDTTSWEISSGDLANTFAVTEQNVAQRLTIAANGVTRILGTSSSLTVQGTTDSTSTTTGALTVSGGLGVAKNLFAGQTIAANHANNPIFRFYEGATMIASVQTYIGDLYLQIDGATNKDIIFRRNSATEMVRFKGTDGAATFSSTTDSSSTSTGSIITSGGVGIAKAAYIGGGLNVVNAGNLTSGIQISGTSDNIALDFSNTGTGGLGAAVAVTSGTSGFGQGKLVLVKRSDNTSIATFDIASKAATLGGSLTTSAPTSGTAKAWKLGEVATVSPTSPNRTIRVEIDGTVYYISAKTTND